MWISFILSFLNSQMQILKYGICCTQIARHQKTAQESEVTCKNKEPLFRLKLGLSNLTDTAGSAQSPEPHPGRVFIGEGQEAGLPTLGVNRLDVIQVRGSWHIGIGFYSIVSWSSVLGKTSLSKKAHEKTHVHRARFNGRPKLPGWPGKRWRSPEPGQAVAFIEGGG
jgi:hypothetical protein